MHVFKLLQLKFLLTHRYFELCAQAVGVAMQPREVSLLNTPSHTVVSVAGVLNS